MGLEHPVMVETAEVTRMENEKGGMNYQEILRVLPHRYPFLFVDGILESRDKGGFAIGFKNVSHNEPYLLREPERKPRLPETIVAECMSQVGAAAILALEKGKIMLFAGIEGLHFYRKVYAGERLVTRVERVYMKSNIGKVKAVAHVNKERVADGFFSFALADRVPAKEQEKS